MRNTNDSAPSRQMSVFASFKPLLQIAAICGGLFAAASLRAQAPAFAWRTNVGATLLGIDAQTNIYANNGNTIITLNSQGIPQATNTFNQPNSVVQRDVAGNFYFAGVRPASVSGSGVDYGTTNACFLTKYTSGGSLVWSNGFGPAGFLKYITLTDLEVDTNGNAYIGYYYNTSIADFSAMVAKLDRAGSTLWNLAMPKASTSSTVGSTHVTVLSPTNGLVLTFASVFNGPGPGYQYLSSFNSQGAATVITNWGTDYALDILAVDAAGNFYTRETNITKRAASGAVLWQVPLLYDYPVGAEPSGGVYTSGGPFDKLTRYDADGNVAWSANLSSVWCSRVMVDQSGNRFLALSDGSIACLLGPSLRLNFESGDGLTPQGFRFTFFSDPNATVRILSSSNFITWDSLGWVTNQTGVTQMLDASAVNSAYKYYKIVP
jgi:hypothetical protein